jgi:tRNA pseudouridine65 synthase
MITQEDIIFQDDYFVAVNKPAKLLTHPGPIDRHENRCAMKLLRNLLNQWVYPVHRLDKPTSGVLLFALSSKAAAKIGEPFKQNKISKEYIALIRGHTPASDIIDKPLKYIWDKMTDTESMKGKPAREAITRYQTIVKTEIDIPVRPYPASRYSLVRAFPQTGRQRQIRRHFKSIFHPIIGDVKHGDGAHNKMFRKQFGLDRLMLHANSLIFIHPYTNQQIEISAPPPSNFINILKRIGLVFKKMPENMIAGF